MEVGRVVEIPGVIAELGGIVTEEVGGGGACTGSILPLSFSGQAVEVAGLGTEPLAVTQPRPQKRARPGDDLASRLLACEVDGRRLEDMEFLLFFLLLVDAGGDTTRNLLSGGLLALMENPDQYAWLMADLDARLPSARLSSCRGGGAPCPRQTSRAGWVR